MRIYCLKLTSVKDDAADPMFVYYTPMSYIDWKMYSPAAVRYDAPTVRHLFQQYVTLITIGENKFDYEFLFQAPDNIKQKLVEDMFVKAVFSDGDKFRELIERSTSESLSLDGCYDYFLYLHLSFDIYLNMLDQPAEIRAHIIGLLEQKMNINIRSRFDDAISMKIPINLVNGKDEYNKIIKNYRKTGRISTPPPNMGSGQGDERLPQNISEMVKESREVLASQLNMGQSAQSKIPFNWNKDEANFSDPMHE